MKEAILRILGLALNFGKKWQVALTTTRYVASYTVEVLNSHKPHSFREIEAINSEFTKCTHFLVTLLNKIIKRGSFPHCKGCKICYSESPCSQYSGDFSLLYCFTRSWNITLHAQTYLHSYT